MDSQYIKNWHAFAIIGKAELLEAQLSTDCVFYSPIVHTPQKGRELSMAYLLAAWKIFQNSNFTYDREFPCDDKAVLEFSCKIDDVEINGVDMIEWDANGQIKQFKVLICPLKAIQKIHQKMGEMLQTEMRKPKNRMNRKLERAGNC